MMNPIIAITVIVMIGVTVPTVILKSKAINAEKETRIQYMEAAKQCFKSAETQPSLTVICPRLEEKDYKIYKD